MIDRKTLTLMQDLDNFLNGKERVVLFAPIHISSNVSNVEERGHVFKQLR